jgi:hypothetical protein
MDNFDENDEKMLIELNLIKDILTAEKFLVKESNENSETLLQNDSSKLLLQAKNPYSKLAFIRTLKDNLICLGFLEESIETLNYFQEDLISNKITHVSNNFVPKKRKFLSRKRSYDKTNIIGDKMDDILEYNEGSNITKGSIIRTSLTNSINSKSEDGEYEDDDILIKNYFSNFKNTKLNDDEYPIVNYTSLSPQPNKESKIVYKNEKKNKNLFGSSSSSSNPNLQINDSKKSL